MPSLADLMPPTVPAGRRSGGQHGHHRGHGAAAQSGGAAEGGPAKRPEGKNTKGGKDKDSKDSKDTKTVEVVVRLTKPVRKRLKARADELGLTPEQAVARLVEVWLEE